MLIQKEMRHKNVDKHMMLQMAVKAINDSAGLDGLIPTLFFFESFSKLANLVPPIAILSQRANAMKLAMKEVRKYRAEHQVRKALRVRNGP